MTVRQLINKLETIVAKEPHKADVNVYAYTRGEREESDLEPLIGENIYSLSYVDSGIYDRVDLNI